MDYPLGWLSQIIHADKSPFGDRQLVLRVDVPSLKMHAFVGSDIVNPELVRVVPVTIDIRICRRTFNFQPQCDGEACAAEVHCRSYGKTVCSVQIQNPLVQAVDYVRSVSVQANNRDGETLSLSCCGYNYWGYYDEQWRWCQRCISTGAGQVLRLTLSLPRVINFKFLLQSHLAILHHTAWRTWLSIAYSDERWLSYQFSLPHLCISL